MSRLLTLVMMFVALVATVRIAGGQPGDSKPGSPQDEAAIKRLAAEYSAGWNEGSAPNATQVFADNAVLINDQGREERGRATIEKDLGQTLRGEMRGTSFTATIDGVQFLKPDVAVAYGTSEVKGGPGSPTRGHFVATCEKTGNAWKVVALGTGLDKSH